MCRGIRVCGREREVRLPRAVREAAESNGTAKTYVTLAVMPTPSLVLTPTLTPTHEVAVTSFPTPCANHVFTYLYFGLSHGFRLLFKLCCAAEIWSPKSMMDGYFFASNRYPQTLILTPTTTEGMLRTLGQRSCRGWMS